MFNLSDLLHMLTWAWGCLAGGYTLLSFCCNQEPPLIWYPYMGFGIAVIYAFAKCAECLEKEEECKYKKYLKRVN